jgi:rhamnulokinase
VTTSPGTAVRVAAVDLGATSGRIMAGTVSAESLHLEEVHRFPNGGVRARGSLFWDVLGIHREMLAGLRQVAATGGLQGIGIDSWAIDYGLLDRDGVLLGNPYSHRDARTNGVLEQVAREIDPAELYAVTGIQQLPFNTLYQLVAARGTAALEAAETLLLLPDLLGYWLTGELGAERTNASTTQLYDATSGDWSVELATRLGLPWSILPPIREAGSMIGPVLDDTARRIGLRERVPVIAVGSHDTASAVVGVPAEDEHFAFISSGTWSLVGVELDGPVLTEAARQADFTNEVGIDGTVRFLKNVMGLWVLSESIRTWQDQDVPDTGLVSLLAAAAAAPPLVTVVDVNDPRLLPPGDIPSRIATLAREAGEPVPRTPVAITRCIVDSLALAYRRHLREATELAGKRVDVVHLVGGGSHNQLLCQLTADACGLPVLAGPAEAAALGNVLVQARTLGVDLPGLPAMRALVRRTHQPGRFQPRAGAGDWDAAESRLAASSSPALSRASLADGGGA